jgi:integrase
MATQDRGPFWSTAMLSTPSTIRIAADGSGAEKSPAYCLHKRSGKAYVTLDGRQRWLGQHGTRESNAEYHRLIGEWLANGRRLPCPKLRHTVSTIALAYWKHAQQKYVDAAGQPTSGQWTTKQALDVLVRLYGHRPAEQFGPIALDSLAAEMITLGWCRRSINQHLTKIKQVFKWAVKREMLPGSIHEALRAVDGLRRGERRGDAMAKESAPVRPVPEQLIEPVLEHVSPQVKAMIELQLLTGARPGELVIMRTCDIDRSQPTWEYVPTKHKTEHHEHERRIFIGQQAQVVLTPFLKLDLQAYVFSPKDAERNRRVEQRRRLETSGLGWQSGRRQVQRRRRRKRLPGDRYDVASYRRAIARACAEAFPPPRELARQRVAGNGRKSRSMRWETRKEWKARLTKVDPKLWQKLLYWEKEHAWHPHQLRHNAGTRLRREYGLEVAQVILGHRTLTATQIYAEKNVELARKVMAEVG